MEPIKAVPLPIILLDTDYTETAAANSNQDTEAELLPRGDRCFHESPLLMSQIFFQLLLSFWVQVINCVCKLSNSLLFFRNEVSNKDSTMNKLKPVQKYWSVWNGAVQ